MLRLSTLGLPLPGQGEDNMRFGGRHTFASCHRGRGCHPAWYHPRVFPDSREVDL